MSYFRITVCIRRGVKVRFTGLFEDGNEARVQTMADYPNAKTITVMCIKGEAANA
jgi:hypothetical protein